MVVLLHPCQFDIDQGLFFGRQALLSIFFHTSKEGGKEGGREGGREGRKIYL